MKKYLKLFSINITIIALLCLGCFFNSNSFVTASAATNDCSGKRMSTDSIKSFFDSSKVSNYAGLEDVIYLDVENSTIAPSWIKPINDDEKTKQIGGVKYNVTKYRTYTYAYVVEVVEDVVSYQSSAVQHIKGFDSSEILIAASNTTEEEYAYALGGGISIGSTFVDVDYTVLGTWGNTTISGNTDEVSYIFGTDDVTGYYRLQMVKNFYIYKLVSIKEYKINCRQSTQKNNEHEAFDGYYFEYLRDPTQEAVASIKGYSIQSLYSSTMFN